jgi:hypothetical protein
MKILRSPDCLPVVSPCFGVPKIVCNRLPCDCPKKRQKSHFGLDCFVQPHKVRDNLNNEQIQKFFWRLQHES